MQPNTHVMHAFLPHPLPMAMCASDSGRYIADRGPLGPWGFLIARTIVIDLVFTMKRVEHSLHTPVVQ